MKSGKNRKKLVTETEFKRENSSREVYKKPAKLDVFFILNWIPLAELHNSFLCISISGL